MQCRVSTSSPLHFHQAPFPPSLPPSTFIISNQKEILKQKIKTKYHQVRIVKSKNPFYQPIINSDNHNKSITLNLFKLPFLPIFASASPLPHSDQNRQIPLKIRPSNKASVRIIHILNELFHRNKRISARLQLDPPENEIIPEMLRLLHLLPTHTTTIALHSPTSNTHHTQKLAFTYKE